MTSNTGQSLNGNDSCRANCPAYTHVRAKCTTPNNSKHDGSYTAPTLAGACGGAVQGMGGCNSHVLAQEQHIYLLPAPPSPHLLNTHNTG
jgi:hypothetical protein